MRETWNTIVVGTGVGGLTAAANLVKTGLKVLVLDRNPHPGGTAYVYHRKGFTFPMGPLGFSNPELIRKTLRDMEIGDGFELSRIHYRIRAFNLDIPISLPFSEVVKELGRLFPSDIEGVQQFFKCMDEITSTQKISASNSNHLQAKGASEISASDYLQNLIEDWRLRRILGSIGTREPYSGLPLLAAMWNLMCKEGIWYPREGMLSFCQRLVKAVAGHDDHHQIGDTQRRSEGIGEIRLNKEVTKIRVSRGKVLGVTLNDGTEIDTTSVISNADYKTTFLKLIDREVVPPNWYRAVSNARQTGSIFQLCLGVDITKTDLSAFEEAGRLIYRRKQENLIEKKLHWVSMEIDPDVLASQELEVSLWGKGWEMISLEGRAVIVIRTDAEYNHFSKYRLGWRQRSSKYQEYKSRLAQALIREIDHFIPGLEKAILVMDVATPLTFEDQGGRSGGAVAGWSWDYEDFRDDQPKELIRTPIKGLYMAGYQAFSALFMGGVPTAMESGKRAAKAVLELADPIEEILIPGVK